jgi:hypothetical protein
MRSLAAVGVAVQGGVALGRLPWEGLAKRGGVPHPWRMGRRFKFRVREGHQVHSYDEHRTTTHGPGYEFVLEEEDAARLLRSGGHRQFDLVEVSDDGPALARKLPG